MPRTFKVVEDRREQIIDAAMRVFAQKGYARATNKDVAHEAGITTGLIYYYFESKEALLKAVMEARSPIQVMAQITPEMLEQPPEVFLPLLAMRLLDIAESEQVVGVIRVMLPEILHDPQFSPIAMEFIQRATGFLSSYLQTQIARGMVQANINPDLISHVMISSMMGFVLRRQIVHDPNALHYTREEIAQAVVGTILEGIRPG